MIYFFQKFRLKIEKSILMIIKFHFDGVKFFKICSKSLIKSGSKVYKIMKANTQNSFNFTFNLKADPLTLKKMRKTPLKQKYLFDPFRELDLGPKYYDFFQRKFVHGNRVFLVNFSKKDGQIVDEARLYGYKERENATHKVLGVLESQYRNPTEESDYSQKQNVNSNSVRPLANQNHNNLLGKRRSNGLFRDSKRVTKCSSLKRESLTTLEAQNPEMIRYRVDKQILLSSKEKVGEKLLNAGDGKSLTTQRKSESIQNQNDPKIVNSKKKTRIHGIMWKADVKTSDKEKNEMFVKSNALKIDESKMKRQIRTRISQYPETATPFNSLILNSNPNLKSKEKEEEKSVELNESIYSYSQISQKLSVLKEPFVPLSNRFTDSEGNCEFLVPPYVLDPIQNSFLKTLGPEDEFIKQYQSSIKKILINMSETDSIKVSLSNIISYINLQIPLTQKEFEILNLSVRIRVICLIYAKYVNRVDLAKLCQNFEPDLDFTSVKGLKKSIYK